MNTTTIRNMTAGEFEQAERVVAEILGYAR